MAGANTQIPELRKKLEYLLQVAGDPARSLEEALETIKGALPEGVPDLNKEVFKYNRESLNPKLERAICDHFGFPPDLPGWRERAPREVTKRDGSLETFMASIRAHLGIEAETEEPDAEQSDALLGSLSLDEAQGNADERTILLFANFNRDRERVDLLVDGVSREKEVPLALKEAAISVTLSEGLSAKKRAIYGFPKPVEVSEGVTLTSVAIRQRLLWTVKAAEGGSLENFATPDFLFVAAGAREGGVVTARLHICAKFTQLVAPEDPDVPEEALSLVQQRIIAALEKTAYFQGGKYERVISSDVLVLDPAEEDET